MLLAIDIGNTNITVGVFDGDELRATWRVATDTRRMADEYGILLRQLLGVKSLGAEEVDEAALCSVVPPLTPAFTRLCQDHLSVRPLVVGEDTRTDLRMLYEPPRDVGADRIADAVATRTLYGVPAINVDFGTATVFDAVTRDGDYLGGAIAPGLEMAADSLYEGTSQLRRVELSRPDSAIGRNTVHAMQSGLVLGYADMVRGMVARFQAELGGGCKVIATGGLADMIAEAACCFDIVDPDLTLRGLRIIHEMNRGV